MHTFASEKAVMARLDARLAKLETTVGQVDERLYWAAVRDLQSKLHEMYWQSRREGWCVMKYLETYRDMHRGLPPNPKARMVTLEQKQRAIDEVLAKLRTTRERLEEADRISPFGLDELTKQIREENETYLRGKG